MEFIGCIRPTKIICSAILWVVAVPSGRWMFSLGHCRNNVLNNVHAKRPNKWNFKDSCMVDGHHKDKLTGRTMERLIGVSAKAIQHSVWVLFLFYHYGIDPGKSSVIFLPPNNDSLPERVVSYNVVAAADACRNVNNMVFCIDWTRTPLTRDDFVERMKNAATTRIHYYYYQYPFALHIHKQHTSHKVFDPCGGKTPEWFVSFTCIKYHNVNMYFGDTMWCFTFPLNGRPHPVNAQHTCTHERRQRPRWIRQLQ